MIEFESVSDGDLMLDGDIFNDGEVLHDIFMNAYLDAYALQLDASDGQTISSNAVTYFNGILANNVIPQNYVMWVGSPYTYWQNNYDRIGYEYCMAVGNDLECENTYFSGTADVYTIRLYPSPTVAKQTDVEVGLNAPLYYSRSNLGDYPASYEYDWNGFLLLVFLGIGGVTWLINSFIGRLRS